MKRQKLFWQFFPHNILLSIAGLLLLTLVFFYFFRSFYYNSTERNLVEKSSLIKNIFSDRLYLSQPSKLQAVGTEYGAIGGLRLTLVRKDGVVVVDSLNDPTELDNHGRRSEIVDAYKLGIGKSVRYSNTMRRPYYYVAQPIYSKGELWGVIRVARDVESIEEELSSITLKIFGGALCFLVLLGVWTYTHFQQINLPLTEISSYAKRYVNGEFVEELAVPANASKEIADMVGALNEMYREVSYRIESMSLEKGVRDAIFRNMQGGVLTIDQDEQIRYYNDFVIKSFQLDSVVKKKHFREVIPFSKIQEMYDYIMSEQKEIVTEITIGDRILHCTAGPMNERKGTTLIGALFHFYDITRLKQLEIMREEFVANVSHELKTPLTSIQGFSETILDNLDKDIPESLLKEFIQKISDNSSRLALIVNDLLTLSSLENQFDEESELVDSFNLSEILKLSIDHLQFKLAKKNIKFEVQVDPINLKGNRRLLMQAISNIMNNAINYSPEKGVVEIQSIQHEDRVSLSIKDQGPGIPKEYHERIFERFFSVDKSHSREMGGSGLGLSIVKHIMQVHGGAVQVESELGFGAKFILTFRC